MRHLTLTSHDSYRFDVSKVLAYRAKHRLSQDQFWSRVDVDQSKGSRYETGECAIPVLVRLMLNLVYGSLAQATKLISLLRGEPHWSTETPMAQAVIQFCSPEEIRAFRSQNGLTQEAFWSAAKLNHLRGSRFERGIHALPRTVPILLTLTHGSAAEAATLFHQLRDPALDILSA